MLFRRPLDYDDQMGCSRLRTRRYLGSLSRIVLLVVVGYGRKAATYEKEGGIGAIVRAALTGGCMIHRLEKDELSTMFKIMKI